MTETTTLGSYLRRERERRGLALRTISENTKVSIGLLEGLEADDISRWPGGIFRRALSDPTLSALVSTPTTSSGASRRSSPRSHPVPRIRRRFLARAIPSSFVSSRSGQWPPARLTSPFDPGSWVAPPTLPLW